MKLSFKMQLTIKLPLTMMLAILAPAASLASGKEPNYIIYFLFLNIFTKLATCFYIRNDFITSGQIFNSSRNADEWLDAESMELPYSANVNNIKMKRKVFRLEDIKGIDSQSYRLRYKPKLSRPRLFWHKFPQQQEQQSTAQPPEMMEVTTFNGATDAQTDEATEVPVTEGSPLPETDPPSTTEPQPTEEMPSLPETEKPIETSTELSSSLSPSTTTQKTLVTSTTYNTIMQPSTKPFPFNLAEKLKNLFTFTQPGRLNLIQKYGISATNRTKSKGFLSLFEVIKFPNTRCSVNMGDIRSLEGICYHEFECKSLGGIPSERCADGVGVCCVWCGDTTEQSVVYFESPNYPQPIRETLICVLVINMRSNVQQLRLDFLMFELSRPNEGDCEDDQFIISGQNINFVSPVLCGINTGQHVYIHAANSLDRKIYLSFFVKVPSGARSFNIKVTQLESDLAPDGCLQYYTEKEGIVKSFNYDIEGTIVENREATYLNNLNYVICIQRAKDICTVTYTMEQIGNGEQLDFQVRNKDEDSEDVRDLVPDGQAGAGILSCPDDFIAINQVRLCGERFNDGAENEDFTMHAPVIDVSAGPIILPFRSNDEIVGRGFRLAYKQELCR